VWRRSPHGRRNRANGSACEEVTVPMWSRLIGGDGLPRETCGTGLVHLTSNLRAQAEKDFASARRKALLRTEFEPKSRYEKPWLPSSALEPR
jgi:hypothetical protein